MKTCNERGRDDGLECRRARLGHVGFLYVGREGRVESRILEGGGWDGGMAGGRWKKKNSSWN